MIDSDNVLLLQPDDATRRSLHTSSDAGGSIYTLLIGTTVDPSSGAGGRIAAVEAQQVRVPAPTAGSALG